MTKIELRGISKRFGQVIAINRISLSIEAGERLVVLGPSGAGKTTLLRAISGLEPLDQGTVLLDGTDVTGLPPVKRQVALVSQDYALYPQLNVQQNLEAGLAASQLAPHSRRERIEEVLDWFEIGGLSGRLPAQLSGGQAQRVAFARALVRHPALLLLDEPLSQLDSQRRAETRSLILRANKQFGTTIVMVTHDPLDAMLLATRIATMDHGDICQVDTPEMLYQQPRSRTTVELTSPFGINWITAEQLASITAIEVQQSIDGHTLLGIRPEQLCEHDQVAGKQIAISMTASIIAIQSIGFAHLATAAVGELELTILDVHKSLATGPARLSVPSTACIWL